MNIIVISAEILNTEVKSKKLKGNSSYCNSLNKATKATKITG